jgi:hypothetical protein
LGTLSAMRPSSNFSLPNTLAQAPRVIAEFESKIAGAPYESKGVLFSEMLFVMAALAETKPARIFESGRARGVSTYVLAACFPGSEIVSVEFDQHSEDVPIAQKNLAAFKHVKCLFGDARQLLPAMVQHGDVVIIDGPKHFRALRLAFNLLRDQKPGAVFIHDCHLGSVERDFLSQAVPQAFYSDDAEFVKRYEYLDTACWTQRKGVTTTDFPSPYLYHGRQSSYGPTFGCIPGSADLNYSGLAVRLFWAGLRHRLFRKSAAS